MSGGATFAECVACHLGYPCLAREVLVEAAAKLGVPEQTLRCKLEDGPGFWERLTSDRGIYLTALQSALADACIRGDLVYHGHAGHLLLKGMPNLFRVRLVAPMEMRIQAVMKNQGLDSKAARDYIRQVDQQRILWTKFLYGVDWRNPANYDVVINLREISINTGCAMVASMVSLHEYARTPQKMKQFADFALACRIKLALATNVKTKAVSFQVKADAGRVEVFGDVAVSGVLVKPNKPSERDIREIVEGMDGVTEVVASIRTFPRGAEF